MFFETMILAAALDAAATNDGATPHNPRQEGVCDATWECGTVAEKAETTEVETTEAESLRS